MEKCQYQFTKPKKKKRCFQAHESPFPVPLASLDGAAARDEKWCYFTGQLVGNYVQVVHTGDIDLLSKMGFFGQGSLWGRHGATQNRARRLKRRKLTSQDDRELLLTSRRKYLRRLEWQHMATAGDCPEGAAENQRSLPTSQLPLRPCSTRHENLNTSQKSQTEPLADNEDSEVTPDGDKVCDQSRGSVSGGPAVGECDGQVSTVSEDPWATEAGAREAAEFWGVHSTTARVAADDWGAGDVAVTETWDLDTDSSHTKIENRFCTANVESNQVSSSPSTEQVGSSQDCMKENTGSARCDINSQTTKTGSNCDENKCENACNSSKDRTHDVVSGQNSVSELSITTGDQAICDTTLQDAYKQETNTSYGELVVNASSEDVSDTRRPLAPDPRCLSDEEDASLFVINDTGESDAAESGEEGREEPSEGREEPGEGREEPSEGRQGPKRLFWQPAMKRDPFPIQEVLKLTLEEAFFLSYGLGCLVVLDEEKNPMKLKEMWCVFCKRQASFLQNYIVYHNLRSKGWVPKTGLKFGGDFVVYKEGPPFYHASYVVLTRLVDSDSCHSLSEGQHATPTWADLAGQNRITEQASKELMICHVLKPAALSLEELKTSPKHIPQFKIQEVVLKRWLLKHERDNLQYMEIP